MGVVIDLILATTDPVTGILLVGMFVYIRSRTQDLQDDVAGAKNDLEEEIQRVRKRTARLEDTHIPDGGRPSDEPGDDSGS